MWARVAEHRVWVGLRRLRAGVLRAELATTGGRCDARWPKARDDWLAILFSTPLAMVAARTAFLGHDAGAATDRADGSVASAGVGSSPPPALARGVGFAPEVATSPTRINDSATSWTAGTSFT